jgi:TonB family protein
MFEPSPVVLVKPEDQKQLTMLYEPPPERQRQRQEPVPLPKSEGTLDSQSKPQPPPPRPEPLQAPREEWLMPKTQATPKRGSDEDSGGSGDAEKQLEARALPPIGIPKFPEQPKEPPRQQPMLEPIPQPKAAPNQQAQLQLPVVAPPSRGTDAILRDMARQQAEGGGQGSGGVGTGIPDANNPNFNMPGPQILSDTMGVDFDPYLLRVYLIVQRNWYSVIPEIARMGRKGRVVLEFTIHKDGSVDNLQMMDGSGTSSMDSAALSSIRFSNPFPPLPAEFPGGFVHLRFGYFYNMSPNF